MKRGFILAAYAAGVLAWQGPAAAADAAKTANAADSGSCESKAVDKNGKPLAGAAKASFMKKCEADAKAAK